MICLYRCKFKLVFLASFIGLLGCASTSPQEESSAMYHEASYFDHNRAPASMSPPASVLEGKDTIDPMHMQSKADYYFTMGESLSYDGKHAEAIESFKSVLIYDNGSARVPLRISAEYIKLGMLSEALHFSEQAVLKDPKFIDAHLLLGGLYSALKTYPKALAEYETVLKYEPNNSEAPLYIGALYAEQKQSDKAAKYFEALARNDQYATPYLAYHYLGRVRAEQNGEKYYRASEEAFKKSLVLKPDYIDSVIALGSLYQKNGKDKKFIQLFEDYVKEYGPQPKMAEVLAQYYLENDNYEQALEQLVMLENSTEENLNIKVRMALVLIEQKQYEQSIVKLHEILKIVPDSDKIRFYLAAVYEESRRFDEAIYHFQKIPSESQFYGDSVLHAAYLLRQQKKTSEAVSLVESGMKSRDDIPQMYSLYASLLDEQQEYQKAKAVLEKGALKFPQSVQIQFFLGTLLDRFGDKDKVITQMKKVIEMDPNHVQGLNYLAFTYAEQGIHLKEAESLVSRALKFDPSDAFIIDTYGWILHKQGRSKEAMRVLESAMDKMPKEAIIAEHLGDVYFKLSFVEKAKSMYEKAISFEADSERVSQIKEKILSLEKPQIHSDSYRKPASAP